MTGKQLEAKFRKAAKAKGFLFLKWVSPGTDGVPDRLLFAKGRVYILEFKGEGDKVSPVQKIIIKKFQKLNHTVVIVDQNNIDHIIKILL